MKAKISKKELTALVRAKYQQEKALSESLRESGHPQIRETAMKAEAKALAYYSVLLALESGSRALLVD